MQPFYRIKLYLWLFFTTQLGYSQTLNSYLNAYLGQNKEGYLQPLGDLLITGLNTGLQPSVCIDDRFYVRLSLTAFAVKPAPSQKTFPATTEEPFSPQTAATVPTIAGSDQPVAVQAPNGLTYTFPGGDNLNYLAFGMPQLTLGGIAGTEVSIRLLPYDFGGDFGKLQVLGAGLRHSISQYFLKDSPIAINIGYNYNQAEVGRYMALQSHMGSVQAGVSTKRIGAFLWAGYQTGTVDMSYQSSRKDQPESVTANLKSKQSFLGGIGAQLQAGFFSLAVGVGGPAPLTGYTTLGFRFLSSAKK